MWSTGSRMLTLRIWRLEPSLLDIGVALLFKFTDWTRAASRTLALCCIGSANNAWCWLLGFSYWASSLGARRLRVFPNIPNDQVGSSGCSKSPWYIGTALWLYRVLSAISSSYRDSEIWVEAVTWLDDLPFRTSQTTLRARLVFAGRKVCFVCHVPRFPNLQ